MTDGGVRQDGHVVVAGGGPAGVAVAVELRRRGFPGSVTIVDPGDILHDRPPLSKGFLTGQVDEDGIRLQPDSWFTEHDITRELGARVRSAAPQEGHVELTDGRRLPADVVVLATGGAARPLPVPGGEGKRVHYLRTVADARRLKPRLTPGRRLLVIGAGLIGAEIASTAHALGCQVTVVDPALPLEDVLGAEFAGHLHALHTAHGLDTRHSAVREVTDTGSGLSATLDDGTVLDADLAVAGIGMVPQTAVARASGARVEDGVVVDGCQRTGVPGLYAVGDCARLEVDGVLHPLVEHWQGAMHSAVRAACDILGEPQPGAAAEWFWSVRYGHTLEVVGDPTAGTPVLRGDMGTPPFAVFAVEGTTLLGAAAVDLRQAVPTARRILERGIPVDPAALADPEVDLRKALRAWMKTAGGR